MAPVIREKLETILEGRDADDQVKITDTLSLCPQPPPLFPNELTGFFVDAIVPLIASSFALLR